MPRSSAPARRPFSGHPRILAGRCSVALSRGARLLGVLRGSVVLVVLVVLGACGGRHLSVPDLVLAVEYDRHVTSGTEGSSLGPDGGRVRSAVTGLVALRMRGRAAGGAPPPSAGSRPARAPAPCPSPRLCAWEAAASRRASRRLLPPLPPRAR